MAAAISKFTRPPIRVFGAPVLRPLWTILIAGLPILFASFPARAQDHDFQQLSAQLAKKIAESGKKSVAVVDFTDLQGNVTELGRYLAEELSVSLSQQANGFKVVDRTYLKAILREHKLAVSGLIDPATASKLGEIAGVQALITGSITPLGDNVSLSVKVLDATTETIIAATMTQIPRTEAINSLLHNGISQGESSQSGASGQGGSQPAASGPARSTPPRVVASYSDGNVTIAVRQCRRRASTVECTGEVTDTASSEMNFTLDSAYLLDNLGNQYVGPHMQLGAGGYDQDLEPTLPMNFSIASENVNPGATSISIALQFSYGGQNLQGKNGRTTFRHMPIEGR